MTAYKQFTRWFVQRTQPSALLDTPMARRKARLIAGSILGLILFTCPIFVLRFLVDSSFAYLTLNVLFEIGLFALYRLSRGRHYQLAAAILVAFLYVSMIAGAIIAEGSPVVVTQFIALMNVAVLIVSVLFNARWAIVVALANLAVGPLLVAWLLPAIDSVSFLLMGVFNLMISAFIAGFVMLRHYEQRQIQEVERRYQRLFETLTDAVCVHQNGLIVEVNPAFELLCDYAAEELIGKPLAQFTPALAQRALDTDSAVPSARFESEMIRKDGTLVPVEISSNSYVSGDQWMQVLSARDLRPQIQAKAALAAERNLLRTMSDNIPDHIYVKDTESRFVLVNRALADFWGQDLIGLTDLDILDPQRGAQTLRAERELLESGDAYQYEILSTSSQGEERWFSISKVPLRDHEGNITGLVGINRDITEERATKARLSDERNLLRALIDNLPDRLFVKDRERRFLLANHRVLQDWGEDDLIGKTDDHRHPPADTERFRAEEQRILETGEAMDQQEFFYMTSTTPHWVQSNKWPLRDRDGNVIGIVGANRDITEHKRFEAHLRYHAELLDTIDDAVISTDINHAIVSWNQGAEQIYGWSRDEVIGKRIEEIIEFDSSVDLEQNRRTLVESGSWSGELIQETRDGRHLNMFCIASVIVDNRGQPTGFVTVNRDVTQQRILESQQTELTVEQERMKIMRQVISDMSHDLKNPLATIRTSLYLLNRWIDNPDKRQGYMQSLDDHVIRLDSMLDNLLSLSRLDVATDTIEYQEVDMSQLLQQVIADHEALASERQQQLDLADSLDGLIAEVDPMKINRVLSNLLVNAISYTPEGGQIRLSAYYDHASLTIEVEDNGIGIHQQDQARIFERFYRVDKARNSSGGGAGLGLSIVKTIVEAHGGQVSVSSSPGEGSRFAIELPLVTARPPVEP